MNMCIPWNKILEIVKKGTAEAIPFLLVRLAAHVSDRCKS